ncbi:hypothetical protein C1890_15555 [Pseudomonas sp. DP16D-R1]|nr:hypothetical protein C1890_15555 [Pseudomonas sp. DP16D-R1]
MKTLARLGICLLLCIALPFNGIAGLAAATELCPMKAAGAPSIGDKAHNCCQDEGNHSDHGNPCKPGQECKTGCMLQVLIIRSPSTLPTRIDAQPFNDFLPASAPFGVWRPPRT